MNSSCANLFPQPSPEVAGLLEQLCHGDLSEESGARLEQLVVEDPEVRRFYVRYLHMHAALPWLIGVIEASSVGLVFAGGSKVVIPDIHLVDPPSSDAARVLFAESWRIGRFRFSSRSLAVSIACCAALFVVYCGFISWNMFKGAGGQGTVAGAPNAEVRMLNAEGGNQQSEIVNHKSDNGVVATLTAAEGCRWQLQGKTVKYREGMNWRANDTLQLLSGVAEITFVDGAKVVLEGPARFVVEEPGRGKLDRGKLVASVPEQAIGFTVATPTATIVDLGTEFGVGVDENAEAEVHVFRGSVALRGGIGLQENFAEQILSEGQAVRVSASGQRTALHAQRQRFQVSGRTNRALPKPVEIEALPGQRYIAYRNHALVPGQEEPVNVCVGQDFVVNRPIVVSRLGAFDSGADGLARALTVMLWSRDHRGTPDDFHDDLPSQLIATVTFSPENPGELIESSRFKPLSRGVRLPPGNYTISAYGYGSGEPLGCSKFREDTNYKSVDDGEGAISFVGSSRYGLFIKQPKTSFPRTAAPERYANRYRAATFEFVVPEEPDEEEDQAVNLSVAEPDKANPSPIQDDQ